MEKKLEKSFVQLP